MRSVPRGEQGGREREIEGERGRERYSKRMLRIEGERGNWREGEREITLNKTKMIRQFKSDYRITNSLCQYS